MANVVANRKAFLSEGGLIAFALFFFLPALANSDDNYDRDTALEISQGAIGHSLGDYQLIAADGSSVSLSDYRGKPLLVSMIFTSCHHICPTTTKHLRTSVAIAREALGDGSFAVVTIGFDTKNDTPEAMQQFARAQGVNEWQFLSATPETIEQLSSDLGFQFFPSPRGFDHLNQLTVVNRAGVVYSQVYGIKFELPWLMEPLKQLVFNRPESEGHFIASLVDRVRLFCTVYNPASGRYEIDNSLFIQAAIGFMIVFLVSFYLWREIRRARASRA
jgi:protein SCO1/2